MNDRPVLVAWTLRTWPKAQYLARALEIPPAAWEIPYLFTALGGPELSVFEAMEKPELGGLTARLKALTKPLAAAAYADPWIKSELLGNSKLALAFHPGVDLDQLGEMCDRDGYRVVDMATALAERGPQVDDALSDEGLVDGHAALRALWADSDDDSVTARTLQLDVWSRHDHSAAFYLVSQRERWSAIREHTNAWRCVTELITTDIAHPALDRHLTQLTG